MTHIIKPTKGQYTTYVTRPLVANDVNAYKIVLDTAEDLTDAIFTVEAKRADGETVPDAGVCSGTAASYVLRNSMYSVAGELVLRLRVAKDNALLTEAELICEVVEGFESADIEHDDRVPVLDALTVAAQNALNAAKQSAAAATSAQASAEAAADELKEINNSMPEADNKLYAIKNRKWMVVSPATQNGDYGLVKLGSKSKGIELNDDGELALRQAALGQIDSNSSEIAVVTPKLFKYAVSKATHQEMSDNYDPLSLGVHSSMEGEQNKLPVSYIAAKQYIDAALANIPDSIETITLDEADDICEGVYKVKKLADNVWIYGVLCAALDLYIYGEDEVDITCIQTVMWNNGRVEKRERTDYIMSVSLDFVQNKDGAYSLRPDYVFGAEWSDWTDINQSKWDNKEDKWRLYRMATVNTPVWANQPLVATLSADGMSVESTRAITAEDLAAYATSDVTYYKIALTNTDGSALPDGCFRVIDVFTPDTAYNADLTEVFYLDGYQTGDYAVDATSTRNTRLVDFVLSDAGVKQFRKAGDTVSFTNLPVGRAYKVNIDGFMGAAYEPNIYLYLAGFAGMTEQQTAYVYPRGKSWTPFMGSTYTNAANNQKIGLLSAELVTHLTSSEANTTCFATVIRAKDKSGTNPGEPSCSGAKETRVANTTLTTGQIAFEAAGMRDYIFLNGTKLKLYYKNI